MRNTIQTSVMIVTILLVPLLVVVAEETSALLIPGQQGQARVIQLQGKNYVEVEGQIQSSLKQTEAAARTDVDQRALPLLTNEFHTMDALTDKYLKIAASRDYIAPNALKSDPMEQKLLTCWQSLAPMASSNQFVDNGARQ
jgi:hypothetical protein